MPEIFISLLVILWLYAPRWFFKPLESDSSTWEREGEMRGIADHHGQRLSRHIYTDHKNIMRRSLFLWRLWLGRITILAGMCGWARFFLRAEKGSSTDTFLVVVGILFVASTSWILLRLLCFDAFAKDVSAWMKCVWLREDDGLPSVLHEKLRALQELEGEKGREQTEQRWELLTSAWREKIEALQQRQGLMEEWLPGLEMLAGGALTVTWLGLPIVQFIDFVG